MTMTDAVQGDAVQDDVVQTGAVKVDVWSDVACPFCYIGKRKFEAAVAASGVQVEIEYHSFELSPDTPEDVTGTYAEKVAEKMGVSLDEARGMEQHLVGAARGVGLTFDYASIQLANTHKAHQLLHYAKAHGRQRELKERLLAAHFTDGRHVGQVSELGDLAAEVGLDRADAIRALEAGEYRAAVDADVAQARAYGINGVPFFVIDNRYGISGAQEPGAFAQALVQARDEKVAAG